MKKLFLLPVAFMFLLSGCEKQVDAVKPTSSTKENTALRSICPLRGDIPPNRMDLLNNVINCPYATCDGVETFYKSYNNNGKPIYSDYSGKGGQALDVNTQDAIIKIAKDWAVTNTPSGCNGIIFPRYVFTSTIDSNHNLDIFLTINYNCCVYGQQN